jgi:hypothetical protein
MKIRNGFVSNSSSSSFVIIDDKNPIKKYEHKSDCLNFAEDFGSYEFGWGPETIYDIGSKICWAYIQSQHMEYPEEWVEMLEKVIKENSNIKEFIWDNVEETSYIDHGSFIDEMPENKNIFESEENLKRFIFCEDSCIKVDNDNH